MSHAQIPDKYPDPMPKPGDIVKPVGHKEGFYGIMTAYGINDNCESKLWCRVYWHSAIKFYNEIPEITYHLVRELEVANG